MGHYDDSYEHERDENRKKVKELLVERVKKLKPADVEMFHQFLDAIDDWRGFYNLVKKD